LFFWVLLLLSACGIAAADSFNLGAGDYLRQGAGARASGMGGAFVAMADDATAGYWNPAGLSQMALYEYQAGLQYAFLPNDMSTSFLSYAFLIPNIGNFSLAWLNFTVTSIETRDEEENLTGQINSFENTFFLSYGRKVSEWVKGLSMGASLKLLNQSVGEFSACGPGLDIGALWQPVSFLDHALGLNVQNLFQGLYWNHGGVHDTSLVNVKAGAAFKFFRSKDTMYFNHLIQTIDMNLSERSQLGLNLGTEFWLTEALGIRAGYNDREVTAGASFRPENYEIDYAFHYSLTELKDNQHRVSLLFRFGSAALDENRRFSEMPEVPEANHDLADFIAQFKGMKYEPEVPTENVPADILEFQKVGGRVSRIILNKGSDQNIRVGQRGVISGPNDKAVAVFTIKQVDPKLSLAEVNALGQEIESANVTAVIKRQIVQ
jgi:hypothetical protein